MKKIRIVLTIKDKKRCPKCFFPEAIELRDKKTMEVLGVRCSKRDCDYFVLYKEA